MVLIGIERIHRIRPSLVKSFDRSKIIFLPKSQNQIFILNGPSISKKDLIFVRVDFIHSHIVRLSNIFADNLSSWSTEVKLANAKLM